MKKFLLAASTCVLSACAPNTYEGLRQEHAGEIVFTAGQPAASVFAKIKAQAKTCHQGSTYSPTGMRTSDMLVEGSPDASGKGVITVTLYGAFGPDMVLAMAVTPVDAASSQVTVTYALGTWRKFAEAVAPWVNADSTRCK